MHQSDCRHSALLAAVQPIVESLENRRLLSVDLVGSVVSVVGTAGPDQITISVDGADSTKYSVSDGVTTQTFAKSDVSLISVAAKGGNDVIVVDNGNGKVDAPRALRGGGGNDIIRGSAGIDSVRGGTGNDLVFAGNGADSLYGDDGNDTLGGGNGVDLLLGGTGNDSLSGGIGNDVADGGDGFDTLFGNDGSDSLTGGDKGDRMYGGAGNDTVLGQRGNDVLAGDDEDAIELAGGPALPSVIGNDFLIGGAGFDTLLAHTGVDVLRGGGLGDVFDARNSSDVLIDRDPSTETVPAEDVYTEADAEVTLVTLNIDIGGTPAVIPDGAGDFSSGKSVAHAVDANGTIEFRDRISRPFVLAEFFQQWGITFNATHIGRFSAVNGHTLTMSVTRGGVTTPTAEFGQFVVQDGDVITITYT